MGGYWLFHQEAELESLVFEPEETCAAMWASKEEIDRMVEGGELRHLESVFQRGGAVLGKYASLRNRDKSCGERIPHSFALFR